MTVTLKSKLLFVLETITCLMTSMIFMTPKLLHAGNKVFKQIVTVCLCIIPNIKILF